MCMQFFGKSALCVSWYAESGNSFATRLGPAELVLGLLAHAVAVAVHALAEEAADRQVHRVIGRDAVHAPDVDLLLEQPRHHVGMRAGMPVDVLLLVRLGAELRVLVPAGVQEQQVALLHLDPVLDHLRRVDRRARPSRRERSTITPGPQSHSTGISSMVMPVGDEVARRVEVRAHVVRGLDVLRVHAVLGLALDVLHLERRVVRPERHLLVQRLRQVVDLHAALLTLRAV